MVYFYRNIRLGVLVTLWVTSFVKPKAGHLKVAVDYKTMLIDIKRLFFKLKYEQSQIIITGWIIFYIKILFGNTDKILIIQREIMHQSHMFKNLALYLGLKTVHLLSWGSSASLHCHRFKTDKLCGLILLHFLIWASLSTSFLYWIILYFQVALLF